MTTDIELDANDGSMVVVDSDVLKSTASDFLLDAPSRRTTAGLRRALVHDGRDGLTINFNGDYPGGVTVNGSLSVTGELRTAEVSGELANLVDRLQRDLAELKQDMVRFDESRIERLEAGVASIAALLQAAVVPAWRTQEEVEEGDNMGVLFPSAESLGFSVEWIILQQEPGLEHGEIVRIEPPPGSVALVSKPLRITVNLHG